jgi:hypothetical protein
VTVRVNEQMSDARLVVQYPAVRRNLMGAAADLAHEEFGFPNHWPEYGEALQYVERDVAPDQRAKLVGEVFVSEREFECYRELRAASEALKIDKGRMSFDRVSQQPEWPRVKVSARKLYDALTPEPRRRLRLAARSVAIEQAIGSVFAEYVDVRTLLLSELPADDPGQLLGYVLLVKEEAAAYGALVSALRELPDDEGRMPFPEVVKLAQWTEVKVAAQELVRWLT